MADVRMRPRFRVDASCPPAEFSAALSDRLGPSGSAIHGTVYENSAVLKVPATRKHAWSPQLHLSMDRSAGGGTIIHGIFGPHPTVWSLFIAAYAALAFLGAMGSIFGYSQRVIGQPSIWIWSIVWATAAAAVVYLIARLGRRIGQQQTLELRLFVEEAIASSCESDDTQ